MERFQVIFHEVEINDVCLLSSGHIETSGKVHAWYKDAYLPCLCKSKLLSMDSKYS